jgi:alpha-galactosidase
MMQRLIVFFAILKIAVLAYDNGLGATPPMGWSTWCTNDLCGLRDKCTEWEVKMRADALVDQGLSELGYKWLLLDDCWSDHDRDADGNLQPNAHQFPSGMKSLADYIHSKGLYLGIYTCVGTQTCKKNRPGSYGHYQQDANTFAAWGVDMVKADNCHHPDSGESTQELFTQLSQALNNTGHPMLFAMCEWGNDQVWNWGPGVSQMYRISMDHLPFFHWPATASGAGYGCGTAEIIDWMADLHPSKYTAPHQWMDPDFLMTSFPITMNFIHSRTEFTFWSLWSAPMLVATDVCNLSDEKKSILTNKEVLAVHSDSLFIAGERISKGANGEQVWSRPLNNGDMATVLFNANNQTSLTISFAWTDLGWKNDDMVNVRDLWAQADLTKTTNGYTATIAPNDVAMLRLSRV